MLCVQALEATEQRLSQLSSSCDTITHTITDNNSSTSFLLNRCDLLSSELSAVQRKSEVVASFLDNYQLDPKDAETLRTGDIDEDFFVALQRVHKVQHNCRALLHTHHQRAGLELLDSMATFQELAYERLCKCDDPLLHTHICLFLTIY
jgi:conserved oligomeric Golgi complex subunit 6